MEIIKKLYSQKIILFTLALIINSCGIYVQYDYDSDVDFNNYNSYTFYEPDIEKVEISDLDKKSSGWQEVEDECNANKRIYPQGYQGVKHRNLARTDYIEEKVELIDPKDYSL